jgi:hypothetical protein
VPPFVSIIIITTTTIITTMTRTNILLFAFLPVVTYSWTVPLKRIRSVDRSHVSFSSLKYQNDDSYLFIDVEVLDHQSLPTTTRTPHTTRTYKELRLPVDIFPSLSVSASSTHDEIQQQHRSRFADYQSTSTVKIKIVEWKKRVGDTIRQGDTIAILERLDTKYGTKETTEVTSDQDCVLVSTLQHEREEIKIRKNNKTPILAIFQPLSFLTVEIDINTRVDLQLQNDIQDEKRRKRVKRIQTEQEAREQGNQIQAKELARFQAEAQRKVQLAQQHAVWQQKRKELFNWKAPQARQKRREALQKAKRSEKTTELAIEHKTEEECLVVVEVLVVPVSVSLSLSANKAVASDESRERQSLVDRVMEEEMIAMPEPVADDTKEFPVHQSMEQVVASAKKEEEDADKKNSKEDSLPVLDFFSNIFHRTYDQVLL